MAQAQGQGAVDAGSPAEARQQALRIVFPRLEVRDLCAAMGVCRSWHALGEDPALWKVLSLQGQARAEQRLPQAIVLPRFAAVEEVNLEFAQGVDDQLLQVLAHAPRLQRLNLNACQQVSDAGVATAAALCPHLVSFSIYWNLRVTDAGVESLLQHCPGLLRLNLSGCKALTDKSLELIAQRLPHLLALDITRCVLVSDTGLASLLRACVRLQELRLYALSNLSGAAFAACPPLCSLEVLDLTGLQQLSDEGLGAIARGGALREIVLTWCLNLTDKGVADLANFGNKLGLLSLHGIKTITDASLEALSRTSKESLTSLDVSGCVGIKHRTRAELRSMFPNLRTFVIHK